MLFLQKYGQRLSQPMLSLVGISGGLSPEDSRSCLVCNIKPSGSYVFWLIAVTNTNINQKKFLPLISSDYERILFSEQNLGKD